MMNGRDRHPAEGLAASLDVLRGRGTLAVIALGAVIAARGFDAATLLYSIGLLQEVPPEGADDALMARLVSADALVNAGAVAIGITFIATAILFLRWLYRLVELARAMDAPVMTTPANAMWAWFIPFLSLVRPYQVISGLHTALEPENVEAPTLRVDPSMAGNYRSVGFVEPSAMTKMPSALIGLWWGAFIVMSIGSRVTGMGKTGTTPESVTSSYEGAIFVSVAAMVAGGLAITVVRGLTARAAERFRRLRESTPEALAAQGIDLR